ncbi:methyl-accepting chemotaxis protein [Pseudorhodoferax sp. Leaf265]|uniref:methyl-accepting chemotaxis protein n=1 Tax=Pseudorhodoferax sp. Leaf265 TaxID=1736315 RepID=UPI0006F3BB5F|nr:methyl-accepting chemotaxis protein [Pseudorhodoferax sp. Leaf265]KQP08928.1 chemotaxis protein [Pseudorhodoferax sp. Leaf265]
MNKLKISSRLALLIGILVVLMGGIGAIGLLGMGRTNAAFETVFHDRMEPLHELAEVQRLTLRNRMEATSALVDQRTDATRARLQSMEANTREIDRHWKRYMASAMTAEEAEMAKAFEAARARFLAEGLLPMEEALLASRYEEARRINDDRLAPLYEEVRKPIVALVQVQFDEGLKEFNASHSRYEAVRTATLVLLVAGVLFALVFGVALVRGIARSLRNAVEVSGAIAGGDLTRALDVRGRDEVALLLQSLAAMQGNLVQIVDRVRQGSNAVSNASAEIAQGNQDLSSRTESQASALQQTAASMEQLSATVRQNADSAREGDALARGASGVAERGGAVVGRVVSTMQGIDESARRMAEIISVIDGIAFQTNILALNAAVEAARAGEQGRGFAVVAGEVRGLAQRSAQAAKEIKGLITESVDRVAQGSALADEAGRTMQEVVASIRRVTDLMAQISAASGEQSDGVVQIGEAVQNMDQATQQNAALVEQMAAAAASLRSQARELVQTVSVFRTGAAVPALHAPR